MENEELAQVLSNAELDNNAKIDAIQKMVSAKYVSADILANERKKFKETLEGEKTNYKNLETEFNDYKQSKMTDDEKAQALAKQKEQEYEQALKKVSRYSAQSVFAGAGLKEEDYSGFLDDIVGLDEERTKSLAEKICQTITKQKQGTEEAIKNKILNGTTPPPAGNTQFKAETEVEKYQKLFAEAQSKNDMNAVVYYGRLIEEAQRNNKTI
jgi:hypothetical protein